MAKIEPVELALGQTPGGGFNMVFVAKAYRRPSGLAVHRGIDWRNKNGRRDWFQIPSGAWTVTHIASGKGVTASHHFPNRKAATLFAEALESTGVSWTQTDAKQITDALQRYTQEHFGKDAAVWLKEQRDAAELSARTISGDVNLDAVQEVADRPQPKG